MAAECNVIWTQFMGPQVQLSKKNEVRQMDRRMMENGNFNNPKLLEDDIDGRENNSVLAMWRSDDMIFLTRPG